MRATFTIVGVLALTVVVPRAESQTGSRVKLGAAFGSGWETRGAGGPSGTHFALSATLRPATSRFGYRLETMLDATDRDRNRVASNELHRHATFAVTVSAVRPFSKGPTGLYAIGGIGLYHQWNEVIRTPETGEGQAERGIWASLRSGVSAGLGYTFLIRGHEMFIESRVHSAGFESRVPVSLGVRI